MTPDKKRILEDWKEAGIIDATDMWPFDRVDPKEQAKQRKQKKQELLDKTEESTL